MSNLKSPNVNNVTSLTTTQAFKAKEREEREREREERERERHGKRQIKRQIKRKNRREMSVVIAKKKQDEERQTNVIDYRQLEKLRPCLFNHDKKCSIRIQVLYPFIYSTLVIFISCNY